MTIAPTHPATVDEEARLRSLASYRVLDTGPESGFDAVVALARRLFAVPVAAVSFVAADRQFFKARLGLDLCETAREGSFCTHAIRGRDVLVVPDAALDERFRASPLVVAGPGPGIRFYAGAPLVASDGHVIGALCIKDTTPRLDFSAEDREALSSLAAMVMERLEARRSRLGAEDGRRRFDAVADASVDAIICADAGNGILSWNAAAEAMFGYTAAEAIGRPLSIIVPPAMRPMHEAGIRRAAAGGPTKLIGSLVKVAACRRDGTEFAVELSLSRWMEGGEPRFGAIVRDITDRLIEEARLKHAAEHDALTGLPNRTVLDARLAEACERGEPVALVILDLDGFKDVNDSLGHAAGDDVLKAVAVRLRHMAGDRAAIMRLGGDEFVALTLGRADPIAATDLALDLVTTIERPIQLGERAIYVGASAGVSVGAGAGIRPDRLKEEADLALYKAKADGKSRVRLFTQELRPVAQTRVSISSALRQAWERSEFELYYQPQVRLRDGAVCGAEALIRWNHPERGVLTPAAFLGPLEESLLAFPVSEWILSTACCQAAAWRASGGGAFRMGVNLFGAQFRSGDLAPVVAATMAAHALPPGALELEITENTILRNESRIAAILHDLRALGVGIAFDDFGTGYASLTMLKAFPVTRLKIDRSFVGGEARDGRNRAVVDAISRLAAGFDLEVIAEGIETVEQAELMRRYCAEGQGYLFGRPMPAEAFARLLAENRRAATAGADAEPVRRRGLRSLRRAQG